MKVLFATDLRGNREKYRGIEELALREGAAAVLYGGDLYPRGPDLPRIQAQFLEEFLGPHIAALGAAGIHFLGLPGNDDLKAHDERFERVCARVPTAHALAGAKASLGGYEFIGFGLVADGPFRLKDRCRRDSSDLRLTPQRGTAILSTPEGFQEVDDWPSRLSALPTLEEELARLPAPDDPARAVYLIHMPPAGVGLDRSGDRRDAGSRSVHKFIRKVQPRMTLHGHAPKSLELTQVWCTRIGRTVSIQPGSREDLLGVLIDLETASAVLKTRSSVAGKERKENRP